MRPLLLLIANILSTLLPQTRAFGTRRFLYRAGGVDISDTAKISGTSRLHHANASIGADAWVGAGVQIIPTHMARVSIGDRCAIGPGAMFVTGSHEIGDTSCRAGRGYSRAITIGHGTWVGARAVFVAGSSTGEGCVVAAGSVVLDSFPPDVLIAGAPARVIRTLA